MRMRIVAFSRRGLGLARQLASGLSCEADDIALYAARRIADEPDVAPADDVRAWAREAFEAADALVFVSACGIAVRAVAPWVRDKFHDPAVVCVDERAGFAIPLLSGHVGGANELARRVAACCGAQAAITTATDVNGCFAVDEWAARQGLAILDRAVAKEVSARLLEGLPVGFASTVNVAGELPQGLIDGDEGLACPVGIALSLGDRWRPFARTLRLVPRVVSVGVGCRRGTSAQAIAECVDARLDEAGLSLAAVRTLATIDVKADEEGLVSLAAARGWELRLHSAEELAHVPGDFSSSAFVQHTVGVDNVCERAACARGETLMARKWGEGGVTVALALSEPRLSFDAYGPARKPPANGNCYQWQVAGAADGKERP